MKFPAYFTGFSSKADGSAGLRFATQELSAEDFAELKKNHNAFGWLIFSEAENPEIPEEDPEEEGISASERLRRVLYVFWKDKKITTEFETWRRQQMEVIINQVKEKLSK